MGWVRIEDGYAEHPKLLAVGPLGLALHVAALCWCNRQLTDGFVPYGALATLLPVPDPDTYAEHAAQGIGHGAQDTEHWAWGIGWPTPKEVARALVRVGLWEKRNGGWQIHDYLQFQFSRDEVLAKREAAKERMARVRGSREVRANNARSSPNPTPHPSQIRSTDLPTVDPPDECSSGPSLAELESAYPADIVAETRQACANSRRSGRMTDSVWLAVLQKLAKLPPADVVDAMRIFVDKYADGERDERYLLGIARRLAKGRPTHTPQTLPAAPASAFTDEDTRL